MQKEIILITGSANTRDFLSNQIQEIISDKYSLRAYAEEDGIEHNLKCDLLIVSSQEMKDDLDVMNIGLEYEDIVICERSVNFDFIDQVASLPVHEEVLLVNDDKETTMSAINDLKELGLNHIMYYPYYPGIDSYKKLKIAITPGETDKIPKCVSTVINLGPRIININSMYQIMDKLNLSHKDTSFIIKKYLQKIINVSQHISTVNNKVNELNGYLNNIINNLVNGILVYDENGYIKYVNEKMKKFLRTEKDLENKNLRNIIDKDLYPYFLGSEVFKDKLMNIMGVSAKLTKIIAPNGKDIVISIDRNTDKEHPKHINDYSFKGYVAKYKFEDIIGSSENLEETKNRALKLAKTDLTVLIEGESGTGKEMFASAIHRNSKRNNGPYLAINFSALPDDLIESELFGYEEGAFTGAKKGGKIGLFELADGGTIFLDEIGDVSPKLQTKLLRVLQEKEIMMLGGTVIKKVDVRIIAATNKNLRKMVIDKQFREDLYYRLKIGYMYLPPLRDRIDDVEDLVSHFIRMASSSNVKVSQAVKDEFMKYKWFGNIRELESTIQYMLAVRSGNELMLSDLPDSNFFDERINDVNYGLNNTEEANTNEKEESLSSDSLLVLMTIKQLQDNNLSAGRDKISSKLAELNCKMTEAQVRTRLNALEKQGYLSKKRGRQGSTLTNLGIKYLNNNTKS